MTLTIALILAAYVPCVSEQSPAKGHSESSRCLATKLVDLLGSSKTTVPQREAAEAKLKRLPAEAVLSALVGKIADGMPGPIIWNGTGTARGDAAAPPAWRAFYSYLRVWGPVARQHPAIAGKLLLNQLRETTLPQRQGRLISALEKYWIPAAEKPVATILSSFGEDDSPWYHAARALLRHHHDKYAGEVKRILQEMPSRPWQKALTKSRVLELLMRPRAQALFRIKNGTAQEKELPRIDPLLLRTGFSLLATMEKQSSGSGYILATRLGEYIGEDFTPNQDAQKYRGEGGLSNAFFSATIKNAQQWWEQDRNKYLEKKKSGAIKVYRPQSRADHTRGSRPVGHAEH